MDLRSDFTDAINARNNWKNNYDLSTYVHRRLLINLMYRAECTSKVFDDFLKGELMPWDDLCDAEDYVENYYDEVALKVKQYLIELLRNNGHYNVGTVDYYIYKRLAYEAEHQRHSLEELEFVYVFEHLCDLCVLYYIAHRLTGLSKSDAIQAITICPIDEMPKDNLESLKECFQPMLATFMKENYPNHPGL